jgi:ETC complex I subunit conserved region
LIIAGVCEKEAPMSNARIYQKAKNAMQSGRAGTSVWVLEFIAASAQRPDPLMGWAGSSDTQRQVRLSFASAEAAKAYADKNGLAVTIEPAPVRVLKLQAYSDNFR